MMNIPTWMIYAFLGAICAGLINIAAKIGLKDVNSDLATAVRSIVQAAFVVAFAAAMGVGKHLSQITGSGKAIVSIIAGGVLGGLSWIFVFRALQLADASKVAPIDKLSMPIGIILAVLILKERPTGVNWLGIALIVGGAYLATMKKAGA